MNGKFVRKIGSQGNGPNQFVYMESFYVIDSLLYIHDLYGTKYLIYNLDKGTVDSFLYEIHHLEMIPFQGVMYFITNYFASDKGYYNLHRYDESKNRTESYLPFDKKISKKGLSWTLRKYSSLYDNKALLIYPRNDIIYEVSKESVCPIYQIEFMSNVLPEYVKEKESREIFEIALKEGYNMGISYLEHTKDLILATYIEKIYKYLIIDKETLSYRIGKSLVHKELGGISFYNYTFTANDEMITFLDATYLKDNWNSQYKKGEFRTQTERQRIENIADNLDEADNPVIFRFRFK